MSVVSGTNVPLTIIVCDECCRPTLFEDDKYCSGLSRTRVPFVPLEDVTNALKYHKKARAVVTEHFKVK